MNFHHYDLAYDMAKRQRRDLGLKPERWYQTAIKHTQEEMARCRLDGEGRWRREMRPYYSVFPVVADALTRLRLDIDCSLIKLPVEPLLVRYAKGNELPVNGRPTIRSILVHKIPLVTSRHQGLQLNIDTGEKQGRVPRYSCVVLELHPGATVESRVGDVYRTHPSDDEQYKNVLETAIRTVCSLALLEQDPEILQPDVLSKHCLKYERTGDVSLVNKAIRNGKRGWLVGAKAEVTPHYRRPHFAIRWTGPGGKIPRVVPVRGSMVKRTSLTEVPTGYLDAITTGPA